MQVTFEPQATPTTHSFFTSQDNISPSDELSDDSITAVPTVASFFSPRGTSTPQPTQTPPATTIAPTRDVSALDTESFVIYDDELNENWQILDNPDAEIDLASATSVRSGEQAIAFSPLEDYTYLFFTVRQNSEVTFAAKDVLGFSFWLNSGDDYIEYDELAVAVIGSNDYTYWRADDTSVEFPDGGSFSETRLYYLGINGSIPPDTWVQIYVWMDILIYDPETNYITGFYIKNDEGFYNTIYIDDLEIVLLEPTSSASDESADAPPLSATDEAALSAQPSATPTLVGTAVAPTTPTDDATACVVSPPPGWVQYTIRPNDAISNLAVQAGVAPETVIDVNCLSPDGILSIGKQIWLPRLPSTSTQTPIPPTG